MESFQRLPLDTLKLLFSMMDISLTVRRIEAGYAKSGRGRHHYPVHSMLLALMFMRFEFILSIRKLCRRLERRRYARDICEFHGKRTPDHTTFSRFITRAKPKTIEGLFKELRDQAFRMGIVDRMHVALCYSCLYAVAITAHRIGRPDLANSIAAFTY